MEHNTQAYNNELTILADKADDLAFLMQGVCGLLTAVTDSVNRGTLGADTELLDAAMFLLLPQVNGFMSQFTDFVHYIESLQGNIQ